jgi:hypothetical protein
MKRQTISTSGSSVNLQEILTHYLEHATNCPKQILAELLLWRGLFYFPEAADRRAVKVWHSSEPRFNFPAAFSDR